MLNYEEFSAEFSKNKTVIVGKNAQGKTNLLESIFVTGMGRSFRTNSDKEMINFN